MKKQHNKQQVEIPSGLKRVNYFLGQLLTQADFQAEQSYFRKKLRLHNLYQVGYGVVSGLEVSVSKGSSGTIMVSPGVAVDPFGNEIILTADVEVPFPAKGDVAQLVLYWAERETDFIPSLNDNREGDVTKASRVEEVAILKYEIEKPSAKLKTQRKRKSHEGITLARLTKRRGAWKVDKKFHVRRVKA